MPMSASPDACVLVAGLGAAGAAAAIEAHDAGARVMVVDRFARGGATKRSGGVVYAGGGTSVQRAAGVEDTEDALYAYLRAETDGMVDDGLLRTFAEQSAGHVAWLESLGLRFAPRLYATKTTQPPLGYGLYFSGNEKQRASAAKPAPRGHVPLADGMAGRVLHAALERAVVSRGIPVAPRAQVEHLLVEAGRVVGVELLELPASTILASVHDALAMRAGLSAAGSASLRAFELRFGRRRVVRAETVVLATGGFIFDPESVAKYAPAYARTMPLGTAGDDGRALRLGREVDAATEHLDRCAASRSFAPPESFSRGILVDRGGRRFVDESLYGATISAAVAARGGEAYLVLDQSLVDRALRELRSEEAVFARPITSVLAGDANHLLFRNYCALVNAHVNRVRGDTVTELAHRIGVPADALLDTVRDHGDRAERGDPDPFGKSADLLAPISRPPFHAVRCNLDSALFPAPCLTLGGLAIDPSTFSVRRNDGGLVPGLHAVGRAAAGLAAYAYVSGLSLADCIHGGRRAGRAAAGRS